MANEGNRPNILVIATDQQRFDCLGCMGSTFLNTPNLDRLAREGVLFRTCCTNASLCAPARIGLAAGLQPARLGALTNQAFLPRSATTYYQRLRDAGYRVGCIGKLDLAKPDHYNGRWGDRPCVYGWGFTHPEEAEGKMHAGGWPTPRGPYGFWLQQRGAYDRFHADYRARSQVGWIFGALHDSVLATEAFEDDYIGRRAAEWIDNVPDDFPWHYFVSFVGPHDPFDPPTEYADRYRDAAVPEPISLGDGKPDWITQRHGRWTRGTRDQVAVARRQYCAAIELIDHQVGRMLEALDRRGMRDNTYVFFTSDHGEMLGDHGLWKKHVAYEASLRVPLIAAGPGIEGGRTSEALIELIDLNPTVCDLAGLPPQEHIDARSFAPILRGETETHRADIVSALHNWRAIRTDRYKLVENYNDRDELYDLAEDPTEQHNLIDDRRDVRLDLEKRLVNRFMEGRWNR